MTVTVQVSKLLSPAIFNSLPLNGIEIGVIMDAGKLAPFTRKRILSETSFESIAMAGKLISTSKKLGRTPPPSSLLLNVSRAVSYTHLTLPTILLV